MKPRRIAQTVGHPPIRNLFLHVMILRRLAAQLVLFVLMAAAGNAQNYTIQTLAGEGVPFSGQSLSTQMTPYAIAIDTTEKLYVAIGDVVVVIDSAGNLSRFAGDGTQGFSGDNGPATAAQVFGPTDLAADTSGNLYIYDANNYRVREVNAQSGVIHTIAGSGVPGPSPTLTDGAPALGVALPNSGHIAVDPAGNVYIYASCQIRKIDNSSGNLIRVAGTAQCGSSGDNGPAVNAQIGGTGAITSDQSGNLFFVDGARVRRIDSATAMVTTVSGGGSAGLGDGGPATSAELDSASGVAVDSNGNVYIADSFANRVREVSAASGVINTIAGTGTGAYSGDNGPAINAQVSGPSSLRVDPSGNVFFADFYNQRVRRVDAVTKIITTVAGDGGNNFSGDGGPASASLIAANSVRTDNPGNVYIADTGNNRIRKVDAATGIIQTIAGNGVAGFSGDGGPATAAALNQPTDVAVDTAGNVYIADNGNARVRRVDASTGVITTLAGGGSQDVKSGLATSLQFGGVSSVAVDTAGNVFVADSVTGRIYKVNGLTQQATLFAGAYGLQTGGAGGPATSVMLSAPVSIAVDANGNLFIADSVGDTVWRVDGVTDIITIVAGTGLPFTNGDGGPATLASINGPTGVAVDAEENVFISDHFGDRVRRVDGQTGNISTIAGTGYPSYNGDGGLATLANIGSPQGLGTAPGGSIYVADTGNGRIRQLIPVTPETAVITGAVNAANFTGIISPGAWVAIFGLNLGGATGGWTAADFQGSQLPTSLNGVSVAVDGLPAAISFVSPTQINIQVPDTAATSTSEIQVSTNGRTSNNFPATIDAYRPALFALPEAGGVYAAAVHADGTLVGRAGLVSGVATRPAAPGETIELYGTGFGASRPAIPAGVLVLTPEPLANPVAVTIGGVPATVAYSGIVEAGVDQINVTVPAGLSGDVPVLVSVNGFLPVMNQTVLLTVGQ